VDNPNKCNIEGDNKLSSRRRELFWKLAFFSVL
jgi:hypothetical protein